MKLASYILLTLVLAGLFGCWCFTKGIQLTERAYRYEPVYETVEQQVMDLQGRVGAKRDGIIGEETMTKTNQAVKREQKEQFNQLALMYFTEDGSRKK